MSRASWTDVMEDLIRKLEAEKRIHKNAIRRHEDMIVGLHNQVRANRKELETVK